MVDNKDEEAPESRDPINEGGNELMSRGNGWELVSLTASTYAASPGPKGPESVHEEHDIATDESEAETSQALFLSGHFVFPPSQHENLPIEDEDKEIHEEEKEHVVSGMHMEDGDRSQQNEDENLHTAALQVSEDFPGVQVYDGKGESPSIDDLEFRELGDKVTVRRGANFMGNEHVLYGSASYSSIHSGTTLGGSANLQDLLEPPESISDSSVPQSQKYVKDDKHDDYELPSGAWWKRPVACLRARAKETNAFWSIFVAAAVMGLVILGQKWQQERWQVLQQ
ncbi:hypothetical protein Dimus_006557 [Dionaea muscipula]